MEAAVAVPASAITDITERTKKCFSDSPPSIPHWRNGAWRRILSKTLRAAGYLLRDELLADGGVKLLVGDALRVLGGDDHGVQPDRDVVLVGDGDLGLTGRVLESSRASAAAPQGAAR